MEPEASLPHSQASATYLHPGPAQSSPYTHISPPHIHPNIIHPSTPMSPPWCLSLRFSHQTIYTPLSSHIRATCPAHFVFLDFITRTILGEEYKSFSSSLCKLLINVSGEEIKKSGNKIRESVSNHLGRE